MFGTFLHFCNQIKKLTYFHPCNFFSYLMEMNYMKPSTTDVKSRLYNDGQLYLTDTTV